MRRVVGPWAITAGVAALAACGDSTGIQPADLAGTWQITVLEFSAVGGPASVDLIADAGASGTVEIGSDGTFTLRVTLLGFTEAETGTITVSGSEITLTSQGDALQGTISRNGDTVTIDFDTGPEYDFDDDGTDEPATVRIVMVRQ